jgi:YfiR/HmsC-like
MLIGMLAPVSTVLRADQLTESRVKAAFLYNFTKFVVWPTSAFSSPRQPFTICVLDSGKFQEVVESGLDGKTIDGRQLRARKLENPHDLSGCQVLFVSGPVSLKNSSLFSQPTPNILTVTESVPGAPASGAMITLVLDSNRVRFIIDNRTAEKAGLSISSKLLSLALQVQR